MNKIIVQICGGTTCHVMGGDLLFDLEDHLPEEVREQVTVEGAHCLGFCGDQEKGRPPFVAIDGEPIADATIAGLIQEISRRIRKDD